MTLSNIKEIRNPVDIEIVKLRWAHPFFIYPNFNVESW